MDEYDITKQKDLKLYNFNAFNNLHFDTVTWSTEDIVPVI